MLRERKQLEAAVGAVKDMTAKLDDAVGLIELAEAENDSGVVADAENQLVALKKEAEQRGLQALLSGEAQVLLTNMASVLPHLKGGRLRVLGVTSLKRSPLAPDVPTVAESGLPKFEYLTWYGMVVPAGTPRPVVDVIARDTSRALRAPTFLDRFTQQGLDLLVTSPADFGRFLDAELQRWDAVVRKAGIKAE